jgi:hypothetical protein
VVTPTMRALVEAAIADAGGLPVDVGALVDAALDETPLEVVRAQLAALLLSVHDEIGGLVHRDYAAFITLSSQLEGLDDGLLRLRAPLDVLASALTAGQAEARLIAIEAAALELGHRASDWVSGCVADASTAMALLHDTRAAASTWLSPAGDEPTAASALSAAHEAFAIAAAVADVHHRLEAVAARMTPVLRALDDLLDAFKGAQVPAREHTLDVDQQRALRQAAESVAPPGTAPASAPSSMVAIAALRHHCASAAAEITGAVEEARQLSRGAGALVVVSAWRAILFAGLRDAGAWVTEAAHLLLSATSATQCGESCCGEGGGGGGGVGWCDSQPSGSNAIVCLNSTQSSDGPSVLQAAESGLQHPPGALAADTHTHAPSRPRLNPARGGGGLWQT